jgi:hypothetical protein
MFSSPTCVGLRYGCLRASLEGFLGSVGAARLWPEGLPLTSWGRSEPGGRISLATPPRGLDPPIRSRAVPPLLRHPIGHTPRRQYRNINLLSIAYASRPRLRPD